MLQPNCHVCVIGAGTMGSGIAAHLANLGFQVTLLDMTRESATQAFERAKALKPPHFYLKSTADNIKLGGIDQDLSVVSEADWVCEAIIEKLDAKQDLYAKIEGLLKPNALISTNTSGLELGLLCEGRSDAFRQRFIGTHFFNPPRYLKLLEVIPGPSGIVPEDIHEFLDLHLGRRVVIVKDTPGFIANRYGMWSMFRAVHAAEKLGLSIEEVDAITGPFIGRPKTASFRLNDLVGLDIMEDIAQNLISRCPHDDQVSWLKNPSSLQYLLDKNWLGTKTRQGYYKREAKQFLSFDLKAHGYRESLTPDFPILKELARKPIGERIATALKDNGPVGDFLREYLVPTLQYAVAIKDEVSHSVQDFDEVMRWGFGWQYGPFELIDAIGAANLGINAEPFYQENQVRSHTGTLAPIKRRDEFATIQDFPIIDKHDGFNTRDLCDGVTGFALTTKMGVFSPSVISGMTEVLNSGQVNRLVLTSEAKVYSAGFDLSFFAKCFEAEDYNSIDEAIAAFQNLGLLLSKVPSVAAVWGFCIGGGYEMAASCTKIVAAPETQIGLPEAKVGLIPGGGGLPLLKTRFNQDIDSLLKATTLLAHGTLSTNAPEAQQAGFLRLEDYIEYHPDRFLTTAIEQVKSLQATPLDTLPWPTFQGPYLGMVDRMQTEAQKEETLSNHDSTINDKAKHVLWDSTSWEDALTRERQGFVDLMKEGLTHARINHMLGTGKPLRN